MARILVVDDDKDMCRMLVRELTLKAHEVHTAHDVAGGRAMAGKMDYDVVFLDVRMPDGCGLELLPLFQCNQDGPECIVITAYTDPKSTETAMNSDVWDYLRKPFSIHEMRLTLDRALKYRAEKTKRPSVSIDRGKIVGDSPTMARCLDLLARAAGGDVTVLITGETGTGKELFARAIHGNGPRKANPMVVVDCTVLPEQLMESVLFGHVKGAFTGADSGKNGLISQADGGTLFLDEVGELPLGLQKKLLRVLQEQVYRPIGSQFELKSDFRLIAATNRNMEAMVSCGEFREDLYYRLKSFIIGLPPLRERREDIVTLAIHHLDSLCRRYEIPQKSISDELAEALTTYSWPGNVRELLNTLDRILAVARHEPTLYPFHLPPNIRIALADFRNSEPSLTLDTEKDPRANVDVSRPLRDVRDDAVKKLETEYLKRLLEQTGGDMKEACVRSGLARSQFYSLIKKHGIGRSDPSFG